MSTDAFRSGEAPSAWRIRSLRRGEQIEIRYRDAGGKLSRRTIRVSRVYTSRYGRTYLEGYCFLAGERRTFRADRILSMERPASPGATGAGEARRAAPPPHPRAVNRGAVLPPAGTAVAHPQIARAETGRSASEHRGGVAFPAGVTLLVAALAGVLVISGANRRSASRVPSAIEVAARSALEHPLPPPSGRAAAGAGESTVIEGRRSHRGVAIRAVKASGEIRYAIPAFGISAFNLRDAYLLIDAGLFERRTGIHDERLEAVYSAADTDGNGHLSWAEVVEFQKAIERIFVYKWNTTALRPDQFIAEMGGDCDDWALFSAGLLHFWGWNASIATFDPLHGGTGHALVFVRVPKPVPGIGSYTVPPPPEGGDAHIPPGTYIPIDYENVGSFSSAIDANFILTGLYDPESLYGNGF